MALATVFALSCFGSASAGDVSTLSATVVYANGTWRGGFDYFTPIALDSYERIEVSNRSTSTVSNVSITNSGDVVFSSNKAVGHSYGGAISVGHSGDTLTMSGNETISFKYNKVENSAEGAQAYGGGIYNSASQTFSGNSRIYFTDNTTTATSTSHYLAYSGGGAIYNYNDGELTFTGNDSIIISGNTASAISRDTEGNPPCGAFGGAIFNDYNSGIGGARPVLTFSDNDFIYFCCKASASSEGDASSAGGVICNKGMLVFSGTTREVDFFNSVATSSSTNGFSGSYGGAVYNTDTLAFSGNDEITFRFTGAVSSSQSDEARSYGGAVYNSGTLTVTDNGDITFLGCSARATAPAAFSYGGAIYNKGKLTIAGNGNVLFAENYEKEGDSYRLCSIHQDSDASLYLAADEGKNITFKDTVYALGDCVFNEYTGTDGDLVKTGGDIIFTGESTEADLAGIMQATPTAAQIEDSRTSVFRGSLQVNGGRLVVKSDAILSATNHGLDINGACLALDNGNVTGDVTFAATSTLHLQRANSISGTLTLADTTNLVFNLRKGGELPLLALSGTMVLEGSLTVTIKGANTNRRFALLSADALQGDWSEGNVTVSGSGFSDFVWEDGTLYLDYTGYRLPTQLTWTNDEGDRVFGGDSCNWEDSGATYAYEDALPVFFGDAGAGEVNLAGELAPTGVVVDCTANYTFSGSGSLVGEMSLVKQGSGTLKINTANAYTGGTAIKDGTLVAGSADAFGTGPVTMTGGTLHLDSLAVANAINIDGTSAIINGGTAYCGNLTLTKGTLSGDKLNLASGKTATLKSGSLKNVLIGAGKAVKETDGMVYVYGANTYTGGTTIKAGALVAKNVKAFGTGCITVTGGTLHIGGYALTNTVNVNGTTAVINGGTAYRGNLYLTQGTLSGQNINLYTGKTATLKAGTVKNVLTGVGKVVKDTTGTAYLYGASTYTGGTTVKAGSLSAKNVKALGTGAVTMTGGSLYLNSLAVANDINVNGTSAAIKGGTKYKGNLTLTKGTLTGQNINLYTGKTATLKAGTVKNVLTGAGNVAKTTTGTAYLYGANTYKGGTTVKAGSLSAKNVKAFGTGAVTMTGGSLYLNSLAATNAINVNGTSATIKGGAKYKGKLTLTKGTLSGDKINIASGKNAYLKTGTVKNALGGTGHVYKQGTGTVTLAGTNNWTGNTYVQGGTLVISGSTVLRGTTRTYANSKLDIRRAVTMGNLYLGGGTLALKAGNMLTVTGTLTLANATKLALSGVTVSSPVLIKYGKLSNTSKKSLNQFFGLTSAYTVTNKGGKLTIAKAGGKKGSTELEPQDDFIEVIGTPETYTASPNTLGQATWGTARAARLFDHTVRDHAQAQSVALDKNRSVWFAGMSGFSHVDDAADINIYGGVVGMQFNGSMGGNAGIAIGQTYGHVSPAGATRVKQQMQHAALYGTKMLYASASDSVSLTGTASYGTTDSDYETLDWTQHSAVLGVRGTWEHKVNLSTAVYGFAGLEYLATDAECGSGSVQALQGSIGAGVSHTEGRLTLHADASFTPDMVRNATTSTVNTGRLGFEVGAGATYRLSDQWSLNAGYTYHNEKRADSHEVYIGARCTF